MEVKQLLRRRFIAQRKAMLPHIVTKKSSELNDKIISSTNWKHVKQLHCFLPLVGSNEPDMRQAIEFAMSHDVTVYTTYAPGSDNRELKSGLQQNLCMFSLGDSAQFDVVIIPMLAYDPATNHRLGFGGGFYDRMLADQSKAQKIGVCFSEFTADLPIEPHDQPLDTIMAA